MEINRRNFGPWLELVGVAVMLLAAVLFVAGMPLWSTVGFAGGFVELLGWLILINTY